MTAAARSLTRIGAVAGLIVAAGVSTSTDAQAVPGGFEMGRACPPAAVANGFSDALDKYVTPDGIELGGLSSLARDRQANAWVSAVDNHGTDPARIWFFRDLADPTVLGDPLVLRKPDGTPYDGSTSDNEGLAVLPDGRYVVSSEIEPSIRIYGRDGIQQASLPVPARFAVTPAGEATFNATLEGLTITPSGDRIIAAMEDALSGDVSATGDATYHRFLVYTDRHGSWRLEKQVAYRAEPGMRIPEVAAYREGSLLVEEAAFVPGTGNSVDLYAVPWLKHAPDVSDVANLSAAPPQDVLTKRLVADLVQCPTLDAPAKEPQTNPLLDNFEGMAITGPRATGRTGVSLISDDNFSPLQTTRILNLAAYLP